MDQALSQLTAADSNDLTADSILYLVIGTNSRKMTVQEFFTFLRTDFRDQFPTSDVTDAQILRVLNSQLSTTAGVDTDNTINTLGDIVRALGGIPEQTPGNTPTRLTDYFYPRNTLDSLFDAKVTIGGVEKFGIDANTIQGTIPIARIPNITNAKLAGSIEADKISHVFGDRVFPRFYANGVTSNNGINSTVATSSTIQTVLELAFLSSFTNVVGNPSLTLDIAFTTLHFPSTSQFPFSLNSSGVDIPNPYYSQSISGKLLIVTDAFGNAARDTFFIDGSLCRTEKGVSNSNALTSAMIPVSIRLNTNTGGSVPLGGETLSTKRFPVLLSTFTTNLGFSSSVSLLYGYINVIPHHATDSTALQPSIVRAGVRFQQTSGGSFSMNFITQI